jgi:hypothetical protein
VADALRFRAFASVPGVMGVVMMRFSAVMSVGCRACAALKISRNLFDSITKARSIMLRS